MKNFIPFHFLCFMILSGCFPAPPKNTQPPDCFWLQEADTLMQAYEAWHDVEITEEQRECVLDFTQAIVPEDVIREYTFGDAVYLHYSDENNSYILVWDTIWDFYLGHSNEIEVHRGIAGHELLHHLFFCVHGDHDPYHSRDEFYNEGNNQGQDALLVFERENFVPSFECEGGF